MIALGAVEQVPKMAVVLLVLSLVILAFFLRNDRADYRAFKLLTSSLDRQRRYRVWTVKSFLVFFGLSTFGLLILHRLSDVLRFPEAFSLPSKVVRSSIPDHFFATSFLVGFGIAAVLGLLLGVVSSRRNQTNGTPTVLGDIEPLLPRNSAESAHAAALSINAGVSEELFFRLFLPSLFMGLGVNWVVAFLCAALIFGLIHFYQGATGVAATTCLGVILTAIYLVSQSLLAAMLVHIGIDLMNLVLRPALAGMKDVSKRRED